MLIWVVGPLLGLVLILKLLNIGFFAAFDRPFDPYQDLRYVGFASQTLRASVGQATGILILVSAGGCRHRRTGPDGAGGPSADPDRGRAPGLDAQSGRGSGRGMDPVLGVWR